MRFNPNIAAVGPSGMAVSVPSVMSLNPSVMTVNPSVMGLSVGSSVMDLSISPSVMTQPNPVMARLVRATSRGTALDQVPRTSRGTTGDEKTWVIAEDETTRGMTENTNTRGMTNDEKACHPRRRPNDKRGTTSKKNRRQPANSSPASRNRLGTMC
jgi:hypothetical protein